MAPEAKEEIVIEDFSSPTHKWKAKNDPVMGGKSTSTVSIQNGLGIFDGQVVNVPFLDAPGFITMETRGGIFPDVSSCQGLNLRLRATYPYDGYRISFGTVHVPGGRFAYGYKADFVAPVVDGSEDDFATVFVPFSAFTAKWDDATGDAIVTCAEDPQYCPTQKSLEDLQNVIFWGEGVAGKVHLEIASITGAHCGEAADGAMVNHLTEAAMVPSTSSSSWLTQKTTTTPILAIMCVAVLSLLVALMEGRRFMHQRHKRSNYTAVVQLNDTGSVHEKTDSDTTTTTTTLVV